MVDWWNGVSACYDLTNPEAAAYFVSQLKAMQTEYGVDGFKLDAGDSKFYDPRVVDSYQKDAKAVDHTMAWARIGLQFPFNEYRACWRWNLLSRTKALLNVKINLCWAINTWSLRLLRRKMSAS